MGVGAMMSVGLRTAWDDGRVGPSELVSRGAAAFWFAEVRLEDAALTGASRVGVRGRRGLAANACYGTACPSRHIESYTLCISRLHNTCNLI